MSFDSMIDELHERARAQTGLADFGEDDYIEGLQRLLDALDDAASHGVVNLHAEGMIVAALVTRLKTQHGWSTNADFAQTEIRKPLIIIGLPRTGTTALHSLLSQDTSYQGFEKWLCTAPKVRPPREAWGDDPQYQQILASTKLAHETAPKVMEAHGIDADEIDECIVPMAPSFTSNWFASVIDAPRYHEWLLTADETRSYLRYANVLKLVGKNDERRWLLKNPSHVFGIDALLRAFPDALIVQTHRDPVKSLSSLVDLLSNIRIQKGGDEGVRKRILARELDFWSTAAQRVMAAQAREPERFINIGMSEIRNDPLDVVQRIYGKFDLPLSARTEASMAEWAVRNQTKANAQRSYEQIADASEIKARFEPYIGRFKSLM